MLYTRCFSCTSRLKWCLREHLPQTSAQYAIYRMFLSHIHAEMVPMANISHKTMPRSLWDVSFTHPGSNGAYRNSSHTPVPRMLSTGCFSYTSRLKWCLQELLQQTCAQYAIYRMFLLHIQAEMVPTGTPPTNLRPVCYIQDVSLTHPG